MNVLAVVAHPDDAELAIGGTLIKHVQNKDNVSILVLTLGEHLKEGRDEETIKSAEFMGCNCHILNFKDTAVPFGIETINAIEREIDKRKPDRIYTHSPNDLHQDHQNTAKSTLAAGRYVKQILFFESPTIQTKKFNPNYYIEITNHIDKKIEVLKFHKSLNREKFYFDENVIRGQAYFRGCQVRVEFAEAFEVHKYVE